MGGDENEIEERLVDFLYWLFIHRKILHRVCVCVCVCMKYRLSRMCIEKDKITYLFIYLSVEQEQSFAGLTNASYEADRASPLRIKLCVLHASSVIGLAWSTCLPLSSPFVFLMTILVLLGLVGSGFTWIRMHRKNVW